MESDGRHTHIGDEADRLWYRLTLLAQDSLPRYGTIGDAGSIKYYSETLLRDRPHLRIPHRSSRMRCHSHSHRREAPARHPSQAVTARPDLARINQSCMPEINPLQRLTYVLDVESEEGWRLETTIIELLQRPSQHTVFPKQPPKQPR